MERAMRFEDMTSALILSRLQRGGKVYTILNTVSEGFRLLGYDVSVWSPGKGLLGSWPMRKRKIKVGPYVRSTIQEGESLYAVGETHWGIFVGPVLWAIFGTWLCAEFYQWSHTFLTIEGVWILAFTIPWTLLVNPMVDYHTNEAAITSRRVLKKSGWVAIHADEISVSKVETVSVNQGIIGRMFGFGTIHVLGTGGNGIDIKGIRDPMEFRKSLQDVISKP
jgi:membrane protein YdbS with pleckstrin-like domain